MTGEYINIPITRRSCQGAAFPPPPRVFRVFRGVSYTLNTRRFFDSEALQLSSQQNFRLLRDSLEANAERRSRSVPRVCSARRFARGSGDGWGLKARIARPLEFEQVRRPELSYPNQSYDLQSDVTCWFSAGTERMSPVFPGFTSIPTQKKDLDQVSGDVGQ